MGRVPPEDGKERTRESDRESDTQRATRLEALRQFAATPANTPQPGFTQPSGRGSLVGSRSPRTLAVIVASVVVLVALGATLTIHLLQSQSTAGTRPAARSYVQIAPRSDGLNCPVDIAWSPDGTRIAALGYRDHCPDNVDTPGGGATSGLLLIYNATTGRLEQRALLDPLVSGGGLALDTQTEYIGYQALLWSHDRARLALPFFAQHGGLTPASPLAIANGGLDPKLEPRPSVAGVLLLNADTLQRTALFTAPYTAPISARAAPEWNLNTGKLVHSALRLPPALGYHWSVGGTLLPNDALSAGQVSTAPALSPVGNPSGSDSFTIWQAGETSLGVMTMNGGQDVVPGLDLYFTRFTAWSPDGAYLLASAYYGGRIETFQPPRPLTAELQASGWANAPIVPARDLALAALYQTQIVRNVICWSPDGQTLVVWNGGTPLTMGGAPAVDLYNARTGRLARQLPVPPAASAQLDSSLHIGDMLRWSPDGKRLALMSPELASLIVWQVH